MRKHRYVYNPLTLNYERVDLSFKDYLKKFMVYLMVGLFFAAITVAVAYSLFDSPKEVSLKREIKQLKSQYDLLNRDLAQVEAVMSDIQNRDDNIYRVIFESDPIPLEVRKAGFGGVNRYKGLQGYMYSDMIVDTRKRLDNLTKQLYVQSKSFDEVIDLAKRKENMLASIPAIQPVSNNDLRRVASGFGFRIHPIYKTRKLHTGIDFSAPTGTPIYATGEGTIESVEMSKRGYGNHVVVNHGFGYKTLYGHMSKFAVTRGQAIKRGDIIGYVGSTGTSTAPHLHYEVLKDNRRIDPINFFFNDLSPEEYDTMIDISSNANQSFD